MDTDLRNQALEDAAQVLVPLARKEEGIYGGLAPPESKRGKRTSSRSPARGEDRTERRTGRGVKISIVHGKETKAAGRSQCICQATRHKLFTNCTACGRVICEQEGEGACFFCGSFVTKEGTLVAEEFAALMTSGQTDSSSSSSGGGSRVSTAGTGEGEGDADAKARQGLEKAIAHKNKLISYGQRAGQRAQVIDDQNDYYDFAGNVWLSEEEKKAREAKAKEFEERLNTRGEHRVTLDLSSRTVRIAERSITGELLEVPDSDLAPPPPGPPTELPSDWEWQVAEMAKPRPKDRAPGTGGHFANDTLTGRARKVYEELRAALKQSLKEEAEAKRKSKAAVSHEPGDAKGWSRVQHDEPLVEDDLAQLAFAISQAEAEERAGYDEDKEGVCAPGRGSGMGMGMGMGGMGGGALSLDPQSVDLDHLPVAFDDASDEGVCLSMHQPWASLLVLGIKRFEGRGWSTGFRGRLWIASTARAPQQEEIEAVEAEYRAVYGDKASIPFPADYPTSALLGCVDMVACWDKTQFEQYRKGRPQVEENISQYVFVCIHPRQLLLRQPISGQHKLWKLQRKVLQGAQMGLKSVPTKWRAQARDLASRSAGDPSYRPGLHASLDIWPAKYIPPSLGALDAKIQPSVSLLAPGLVHIKSFLSIIEQQQVVDMVRETGLGPAGFYVPTFEGDNHMNLRMFCYGLHWNPRTHLYEEKRSNRAAVPAPPLPALLSSHAQRMQEQARNAIAAQPQSQTSRSKIEQLPWCKPDVCVVNFYMPNSGRLGVHQDVDETKASKEAGLPILSLSIGDTADFVYGYSRPDGGRAGHGELRTLRLSSGDALLFGGPARLIYHGVDKVHPNTAPRQLCMRPGRLNLTMRQYDV